MAWAKHLLKWFDAVKAVNLFFFFFVVVLLSLRTKSFWQVSFQTKNKWENALFFCPLTLDVQQPYIFSLMGLSYQTAFCTAWPCFNVQGAHRATCRKPSEDNFSFNCETCLYLNNNLFCKQLHVGVPALNDLQE